LKIKNIAYKVLIYKNFLFIYLKFWLLSDNVIMTQKGHDLMS